MSRWLGVDYGKRRIGLALSDPGERIASPLATLAACGTVAGDAQLILRQAQEYEAPGIVVGLPLNMDGTAGPQAELSRGIADEIRRQGGQSVELWDERLSSYQADQIMQSAGLRPSRQRSQRDALAAQVILQSFLDARRPTDDRQGQP